MGRLEVGDAVQAKTAQGLGAGPHGQHVPTATKFFEQQGADFAAGSGVFPTFAVRECPQPLGLHGGQQGAEIFQAQRPTVFELHVRHQGGWQPQKGVQFHGFGQALVTQQQGNRIRRVDDLPALGRIVAHRDAKIPLDRL